MYQLGRGVEQSYEKAAHWYEQAAAQGDAGAQEKVAELENKAEVTLARPVTGLRGRPGNVA